MHRALKKLGAWQGRRRCDHCAGTHIETFDVGKCGGIAGLDAVVEGELGELGWAVKK